VTDVSSVLEVPTALIMALTLAASAESGGGQLAPFGGGPPTVGRIDAPAVNPFALNEQAWLAAFRRNGGLVGQADLASRIFITSGKQLYVPVAQERSRILAMRDDVVLAGQLTLISARQNAADLSRRLGRSATSSDLLAAHLFGLDDAEQVLRSAATSPNAILASILGAKAFDVPELFFAGSRPRRAIEVVTELRAAVFPRSPPLGASGQRKRRSISPSKIGASS
jgi:hypothetical protein